MVDTVPWIDRRFFHWAHQGGAREGPSNTLRAMRRALAAGAHGLELDVHLTAEPESVLIVAHDDSLKRMAGQDRRISEMTLADIQTADAAYNWVPGKVDAPTLAWGDVWPLRGQGPADVDLRIPTLADVVEAFPDVPLNLEIKDNRAARPLARFLEQRPELDVIVVSFRDTWLARFKWHAKRPVPTAPGRLVVGLFWFLSRFGIALRLRRHVAIQIPHRLGPFRILDRRLVDAAHRSRLAVHVWTVDDPNSVHDAIDLECDGVMSDRPSVVSMVLSERPVGWSPPMAADDAVDS